MNVPGKESMSSGEEGAIQQRIRAEAHSLLSQLSTLAHLEKAAAVTEQTMHVAHDIRNPLATISAVCSTLILESDDPEQRERLTLVSEQVDRLAAALANAVNATLQTEDPPQPLDAGELIRSLVHLLQYQIVDDLVFHLRLEPDLRCRLPPRGLTRSIYHLMRNAVDAVNGAPSGEVLVDCRKTDSQLELRVDDNGPGLPEALLNGGVHGLRVARASPSLGLSTVDRFARGLGGTLTFARRDVGGAAVCLRLPLDQVPGGS